LLFPAIVKVVFAADGTGWIKAKLDPIAAARAVRRKRAKKISDNLIQYKHTWHNVKPLVLTEDDNVILLGTVSSFTKRRGWLKVANQSDIRSILNHNKRTCRFVLLGLGF
jgi:hypothetical protein